jgi:hypothetical protein
LIHKATGFLPAAKGAQTLIQIQNNQNQPQQAAAPQIAPAPSPERTVTRLVDRFNAARKQLPESIPAERIPAPEIIPPVPQRELSPVGLRVRDESPEYEPPEDDEDA